MSAALRTVKRLQEQRSAILRLVIPEHLFPLFWDIDCKRFEPNRFPDYTILRILEYGDVRDVKWLEETFAADQIASVICSERRLTPRSARFWSLVYGIPTSAVRVLRPGPRLQIPGWRGSVCP